METPNYLEEQIENQRTIVGEADDKVEAAYREREQAISQLSYLISQRRS